MVFLRCRFAGKAFKFPVFLRISRAFLRYCFDAASVLKRSDLCFEEAAGGIVWLLGMVEIDGLFGVGSGIKRSTSRSL